MLVSVIMCTCRRAEQIRDTWNSLTQVRIPDGLEVEVLVIQNGIGSAIEALLKSNESDRFALRYLHEPQKSKSKALNRGIKEAKGEIYLFVDDDLRFSKEWLYEMTRPILEGNASAVTGPIYIPKHLRRDWMIPYHMGWLGCIRYSDPERPDEMAGANMAFHRKVLNKVPRFDEELGGGGLGNCEDTLFSRQVREAGFPIHLAAGGAVDHHFEPSKLIYSSWVRNAEAAGRSRAYLLYHWYHSSIPLPRTKYIYTKSKLLIRKQFSRSYHPSEEGILAWELSYRYDLALLRQYIREQVTPRKYTVRGLSKLNLPS